jgi:hypothetical protein
MYDGQLKGDIRPYWAGLVSITLLSLSGQFSGFNGMALCLAIILGLRIAFGGQLQYPRGRTRIDVASSPKALRWLLLHFHSYRTRSPWSFCWRITIEAVVVSFGFGLLVAALFDPARRTVMDDPTMMVFLYVVIIGPFLETILFQAFPVFIARLCRVGFVGQMLFSMVPFALAHFSSGIGVGVCAGVVGGFYLAFTYVHWRQKSLWTALWVTAMFHVFNNSVRFLIKVLLG